MMASVDLANFRNWYARVLADLREDRNNGIAAFTIALPPLERYLRGKCRLRPSSKLNTAFFRELVTIFPVLTTPKVAADFWSVYRNGILHQTVPSRRGRKGRTLPGGCFTHDISNAIEIDEAGAFTVHPDRFAQRVVDAIEADFGTYENAGTFQPPLMRVSVQTVPSPYPPQVPNALPIAVTTKTN